LIDFSQLPPEFIEHNLTTYQIHSLVEKYYIYNFIESHDLSNNNGFKQLAEELGLSFQTVVNKYYSIKY